MRRELHVRFCEGGGVRLPSATRLVYSLALGTGLRLAEIVGLNVGDVFAPDGTPRSRVRIRAVIAKGGRTGDVFLPDALVPKLRRFWAYKRVRGEGTCSQDPLFCSQSRVRISRRRVQFAWRQWQVRAGFDRLYSFHSIRHTAVTAVYRASHDLFLAQRFARHVSPLTTTVYTHPSDEEMYQRVRGFELLTGHPPYSDRVHVQELGAKLPKRRDGCESISLAPFMNSRRVAID